VLLHRLELFASNAMRSALQQRVKQRVDDVQRSLLRSLVDYHFFRCRKLEREAGSGPRLDQIGSL